MCKDNRDETFTPILDMLRTYYHNVYMQKPCTHAHIAGAATRDYENKYHEQLAKDMKAIGK